MKQLSWSFWKTNVIMCPEFLTASLNVVIHNETLMWYLLVVINVLIFVCIGIVADWNNNKDFTLTGDRKVRYGTTAEIKCTILPPVGLQRLVWEKQDSKGNTYPLELSHPKYSGSNDEGTEVKLCINQVDKNDTAKYRIAVYGKQGSRKGCSDGHFLEILGEMPSVRISGPTILHYGQTGTLKACIQSEPRPTCIFWQKLVETSSILRSTTTPLYVCYGIDVSFSKYENSVINDDMSELVINNVNKNDEGLYELTVYNELGGGKSNAIKLEVTGEKPTVEIESKEITAIFGDDVELTGTVHGIPASDTVSWWKLLRTCRNIDECEKEIIDISEAKYQGSSIDPLKPKLCIHYVNEHDEAKYQLEASNIYGNGFSEVCRLYVNGEKPSVKIFEPLRNNESALYGDTVRYRAAISSEPKMTAVLWKHIVNNEEKVINITVPKYMGSKSDFVNPELRINALNRNDEGNYIIEAENVVGSTKVIYKFLHIIAEKPDVRVSGQSRIEHGKHAIIKGTIKAIPKPKRVCWRKIVSATVLDININTPKYQGSTADINQNEVQLLISNVDFSDAAKYQLEVENLVGIGESTSELNVTGKPKALISGPTLVSENSKIRIDAIIPDNAEILEWKQSDIVLDPSCTKYSQTRCDGTLCKKARLEIFDARLSDSAQYQLVLSSKNTADHQLSNHILIQVTTDERTTKEGQNNGFRLFQLQELSASVLREVFDSEIGLLNSHLSKQDVYKKIHESKKWTQDQKDKLYPGEGSLVSSTDLDVTLMYKLLRDTSTIGTPSKGWGRKPGMRDVTPSDHIERIRLFRNDISHSASLEIETIRFNEQWLQISQALNDLSNETAMKKICTIQNKVMLDGDNIRDILQKMKELKERVEEEESQCANGNTTTVTSAISFLVKEKENYHKNKVGNLLNDVWTALNDISNRTDNNILFKTIFAQIETSETLPTENTESYSFIESVRSQLNLTLSCVLSFSKFVMNLKFYCGFPDITCSSIYNSLTLVMEFDSTENRKKYEARSKDIKKTLKDLLLSPLLLQKFDLLETDITVEEMQRTVTVIADIPHVVLVGNASVEKESTAVFNAVIWSGLHVTSVKWHMIKNGNTTLIDVNDEKFAGSSSKSSHPQLCINNVTEDDEATYKVTVTNSIGPSSDAVSINVVTGRAGELQENISMLEEQIRRNHHEKLELEERNIKQNEEIWKLKTQIRDLIQNKQELEELCLFHEVCGNQLELSQNRMKAMIRDKGESCRVCFSKTPVAMNENLIAMIQVENNEDEVWLEYGFTTINPDTLSQKDLPDILFRKGDENSWREDEVFFNTLNMKWCSSEPIQFSYNSNGKIESKFVTESFENRIPNKVKKWAIFEIYENIKSITMERL